MIKTNVTLSCDDTKKVIVMADYFDFCFYSTGGISLLSCEFFLFCSLCVTDKDH